MLTAHRIGYGPGNGPSTHLCTQVWTRKDQPVSPTSAYGQQLQGLGDLGLEIPGLDTMATAAKAIFYVGVGTALIVTSMFAWRVIDTFLPE